MTRFLTLEQVLQIHTMQIEAHGGQPGHRDLGLIESAVNMPLASYGGTFAHETIWDKAAAYLFHLNKNHGFVDGNKRVALASCLYFLKLNGVTLTPDKNESLIRLSLNIANNNASKIQVATLLQALA